MKRGFPCVGAAVAAVMLLTLASCRQRSRPTTRAADFSSCVASLTNVAGFSETPLGKAHLESTYDRTGGNSDWGTLENPESDGLKTLVNLKGPGCVTRIWQTSIPAERWSVFIDDESVPRLSYATDDIFGKKAPSESPLGGTVSGGAYSYGPIPFEKSLRLAIKARHSDRPYYQVNYETYDASVQVVSFPKQMNARESDLAKQVRGVWTDPATEAKHAMEACRLRATQVVMPGRSETWLDLKAAGVVRTFWVRWTESSESTALARARRLRELVLRFYWDGAECPSVDVPFGDFFCNGLWRRNFSSLPVSVLDGVFVCRFPMPFRKAARAEIRNDGPLPVNMEIGYDVQPLGPEDNKDLNVFHACWNYSKSSGLPHRVLRTEGRGHYVGCYLIAIGTDGTWNMLEGDESMYLNGQNAASMHGTGLEDYFNGGWYYYGLFDLPLHGLLEKAAMRTCQYRFHLADRVGFDNGFLMNWEFGCDSANMGQGYMSSVAYWYQPEPHPAGTRMPPVAERFPPADRQELGSIMSGLFELEFIGRDEEAAERCDMFAEKFAGNEYTSLLRLRASAYRERIRGFDNVKGEYAAMAQSVPGQPASQQAQLLTWFHSSTSNAILVTQGPMNATIFLDGKQVGQGSKPFDVLAFPVAMTPGEHEIAAEVVPLCRDPWFSFDLRAWSTNVISDQAVEWSRVRPPSWPRTDGVTWTNLAGINQLPKMAWWQFVPNAFVYVQSGRRVVEGVWDGWDKQPFSATYLRKRFTVP
jgi:hypothetical protein